MPLVSDSGTYAVLSLDIICDARGQCLIKTVLINLYSSLVLAKRHVAAVQSITPSMLFLTEDNSFAGTEQVRTQTPPGGSTSYFILIPCPL